MATAAQKPKRRAYPTIQRWMEDTGTNQARLAELAGCTQSHLSNILSKSRRCSIALAWKLSQITNVPVETLIEWPPVYAARTEE